MSHYSGWKAGGTPCAPLKQKINPYTPLEDELITSYLIKQWWEKESEQVRLYLDWHDRMAAYLHNQKNRDTAKRMLANGWA